MRGNCDNAESVVRVSNQQQQQQQQQPQQQTIIQDEQHPHHSSTTPAWVNTDRTVVSNRLNPPIPSLFLFLLFYCPVLVCFHVHLPSHIHKQLPFSLSHPSSCSIVRKSPPFSIDKMSLFCLQWSFLDHRKYAADFFFLFVLFSSIERGTG